MKAVEGDGVSPLGHCCPSPTDPRDSTPPSLETGIIIENAGPV